MKKWSIFFLTCYIATFANASVKLTGSVGKYTFTMELVASTSSKDYNVRGRYQYTGKSQYLDLKGNLFGGNVLQLTESFEGKETGDFYLEWIEGEKWAGKWIAGSKCLDAELKETSGEIWELMPYDLNDYYEKVNASITGTYVDERYWVNDFQFSEENPVLEVGFNGGVVTVKEVGKDKIEVEFELVCGPTYHMAYFGGTADRVGPGEYHYKGSPMDDGEICELHFKFSDKSVDVSQHSDNVSCGFGARAYADGSFSKVNNVAVDNGDEELTIDLAIGRK